MPDVDGLLDEHNSSDGDEATSCSESAAETSNSDAYSSVDTNELEPDLNLLEDSSAHVEDDPATAPPAHDEKPLSSGKEEALGESNGGDTKEHVDPLLHERSNAHPEADEVQGTEIWRTAGDQSVEDLKLLKAENAALKVELGKQAREIESLTQDNATLQEKMSKAEAAQINELKSVYDGLTRLKERADSERERSRLELEMATTTIQRLEQDLQNLQGPQIPLYGASYGSEIGIAASQGGAITPQQSETDQYSELVSEPPLLLSEESSEIQNMLANIKHLEQTNAGLQESLAAAEHKLRQQPEIFPPTGDESRLDGLQEAQASELHAKNSELMQELAAANSRIHELETCISTLELQQQETDSIIASIAELEQTNTELMDKLLTAESKVGPAQSEASAPICPSESDKKQGNNDAAYQVLQGELASATERIRELESQLSTGSKLDEKGDLLAKIEQLEKNNLELQDKLATAESTILDMQPDQTSAPDDTAVGEEDDAPEQAQDRGGIEIELMAAKEKIRELELQLSTNGGPEERNALMAKIEQLEKYNMELQDKLATAESTTLDMQPDEVSEPDGTTVGERDDAPEQAPDRDGIEIELVAAKEKIRELESQLSTNGGPDERDSLMAKIEQLEKYNMELQDKLTIAEFGRKKPTAAATAFHDEMVDREGGDAPEQDFNAGTLEEQLAAAKDRIIALVSQVNAIDRSQQDITGAEVVAAKIRELEQNNLELQGKLAEAESKLNRREDCEPDALSSRASMQESLVMSASTVGEDHDQKTSAKLENKLAAAKNRIKELEDRIKTIDDSQGAELSAEESQESVAKMLVLEGQLSDALKAASGYKKKLKAEKLQLEKDQAALHDKIQSMKDRYADLEYETQELKATLDEEARGKEEAQSRLKVSESRCADLEVSLGAEKSRCQLQESAITDLQSKLSNIQASMAEQENRRASDAALNVLIDEVELNELRRLESLRLKKEEACIVQSESIPTQASQASEAQHPGPGQSETQSASSASSPSATEAALSDAKAKIASLKAELQAVRFELRREENSNFSRSAEWSKTFNPSPRDTQRLLQDVAHLPREGLLAELERVCDMRQEATFIAELRKEQLDKGVREAGQAAAEVAQLKGKLRVQKMQLLEVEEKLQEKNREVALLHTKNENMKKILEDEEAETGIKKLKKRLKKTYKKVKAKDSTIRKHLDEGKHLWHEVNSLLSTARPASADAMRRLGIASEPVTPFKGMAARPQSAVPSKRRSARDIMFGNETARSHLTTPGRRAWDDNELLGLTSPATEPPMPIRAWGTDHPNAGSSLFSSGFPASFGEDEDEEDLMSATTYDSSHGGESSRQPSRPSSAMSHKTSPLVSGATWASSASQPYRTKHRPHS